MKVIVDFGEGVHVVLDIDRMVVKDDCILVKQADDGTAVVAGIRKQDAERYTPECTEEDLP